MNKRNLESAVSHEQTIPMEIQCSSCKGEGGEWELGEWVPCCWCEGTGFVPTEFGKQVLELVRHNFYLILESERRNYRLVPVGKPRED